MADVEKNLEVWEQTWDWSQGGEEWSLPWGGTPLLWYGVLLPRIHGFVPAGRILEIAPGFGRWTRYLKDLCEELIVVDLSERCIEHCRERFADAQHIEYHVNDGRSLEMIADRSIDFAFSFDSLVHAEADVLEAYLAQLAKKLTPDGVAFIHHSNIASYRYSAALARRAPEAVRSRLVRHGILVDVYAWRAESVSAEKLAAFCEHAGLSCVSQELINWERGWQLIDALSVLTPDGSSWARPRQVVSNRWFRRDAARLARLYSRPAER